MIINKDSSISGSTGGQLAKHNNVQAADGLSPSTDQRTTAFQLAGDVLRKQSLEGLQFSDSLFCEPFSIPEKMSQELAQTLNKLSLLANKMIRKKEKESPLALETSLSQCQPIALSEKEHEFLKLFKQLLDKSLEAKEYQGNHNSHAECVADGVLGILQR